MRMWLAEEEKMKKPHVHTTGSYLYSRVGKFQGSRLLLTFLHNSDAELVIVVYSAI